MELVLYVYVRIYETEFTVTGVLRAVFLLYLISLRS